MQVNDLTSMNAQLVNDVDDAAAAVLALKESRLSLEDKLQQTQAEMRHVLDESTNSAVRTHTIFIFT